MIKSASKESAFSIFRQKYVGGSWKSGKTISEVYKGEIYPESNNK